MLNFSLISYRRLCPVKTMLAATMASFYVLGGSLPVAMATEFLPGTGTSASSSSSVGGGSSAFAGSQQSQQQVQQQAQEQFQDQSQLQRQRQGDNSVSVDGDETDYFALALPNLVAANCAGASYSFGGGGGGVGFGFGQATIDENCQIAKAIATAHLLEGADLIDLSREEYRRALCQMRGMEHICKLVQQAEVSYPAWCGWRLKRDTKASLWSDRDLSSCGINSRERFESERTRWLQQASLRTTTTTATTDVERVTENQRQEDSLTRDKVDVATKPSTDCCPSGQDYVTPEPPEYVVVRVGQHCGYDRVVFDWPEPVDYGARRDGDVVFIDFDSTDSIDVSKVRRYLGRFIVDASAASYGSGTRATLTLADGVEDRVWTWDRRVIIDGRKSGCPIG